MTSRENRRAYGAEYRERNREKLRLYQKAYREANYEQVRATQKAWDDRNTAHKQAYAAAHYSANKAKKAAQARARNYGLTPEAYAALLERADGRCEMCREVLKRICVDHDHTTGAVRGLLCNGCNGALGRLGDNEAGLLRALAYLRRDANIPLTRPTSPAPSVG